MKGKNIRPIHDRVLIRPDAARTKTDSGIIIPDTVVERPHAGEVVAIGPGLPGEPTTVKAGDRALFTEHSGTKMTIGEETLLLMRECDIIGVENEEDVNKDLQVPA